MNKEEILAMDTGTALDVLIAEKVMNWYLSLGEYSGKGYWNDENDHSPWSVKDFKPSTDIKAAWDVLEKLVDQGLTVGASKYGENNLYYCHVLRGGFGVCDTQMMKSAPEAICKAALLAVMDS